MQTKDYIALAISVVSAIVAISALWLTHFRRPQVEVALGPDAHIYHPRDGGTAIYLPFVITNTSPRRALVRQIFLQITAPDGSTRLMRWMREAAITPATSEYEYKDRVKPVPVDAFSSESRVYWFLSPENPQDILTFVEGRYTFTAHIWLTRQPEPDMSHSQSIAISAETAEALSIRRRTNDSQTRIHYFEGQGLISAATANPTEFWKQEGVTPP